MRIACTLAGAAALVALGLNQGAAVAQTAADATAGSAGVSGSAGWMTGALSPSSFGGAPITGGANVGMGAVVAPGNGAAMMAPIGPTTGGVGPTMAVPYYIYVPYAVGGGPIGGGYVPAQPGGAASESVVAPQAEPQPEYRSVPGGRANFDLDDPYYRAAVSR